MKICLMEMDDRTRQSIALVLRHRANGLIALADEDAAEMVVLDLDHENALASYQSLHARRSGLRAIGLTSQSDRKHEGILVLRKPIAANSLLEAIGEVSGVELRTSTRLMASGAASSLSARIGHSRRRAEPTATPARDKLSFDPNAYLLGNILNAAAEAEKRDVVAVIRFYGDRIILVDNTVPVIRTNLSSSQARAFSLTALEGDSAGDLSATVGLQRPSVEYVARAEAVTRYEGQTYAVPREIFMWKLGAMTSRGRLPADIRADERVYLRRWPNMTRFSYSDNDMRIVAYWMQQADSLAEIASALGVAEQEVFKVYTAAFAAGLAGKARREVDGVWEAPEVVEHKERGLFSSILKRLLQRKPAGTDVEQEAA